MKARTARQVIGIRFNNLEKYYAAMKQATGMEDIHLFRVEIKKLKAFLRLAGATYGKKISIPHALKKIYQAAGKVRDLQVHSETLKHLRAQHDDPAPYLQHMKRKLGKAKKNLINVMHDGVLERSRSTIKKEFTHRISSKSVCTFYHKKFTRIRIAGSCPFIPDDDLHMARKNVKDILYIAKSFETDLGRHFPLPGWNKKTELYFTILADELGHFQDCRTGITHLQGASHNMTDQEKKILNTLLIQKQQSRNDLVQLLTINPL